METGQHALQSSGYRTTATILRTTRAGQLLRMVWLPFSGLIVLLSYLYFLTAGTMDLPPGAAQYGLLTEAFLAGQLHLRIDPSPELLASANPYDPHQKTPGRLSVHDASFYNGRLYIYWGPVPAIIRMPWYLATHSHIPSSVMQLVAGIGAFFGAYLLFKSTSLFGSKSRSNWIVIIVTLAFSLGGVMLFLIARPSVYHEPFSIAICLTVWSWYCCLRAWKGGQASDIWMLAAGLLMALAIATRITYIGYAVGPILASIWLMWRGNPLARSSYLRSSTLFGAPIVLCVLMLALYNWLRFGSPLETGQAYILYGNTALYDLAQQHPSIIRISTIPQAAFVYLFHLPAIQPWYPYFDWHTDLAASWQANLRPAFMANKELFLELPLLSVFVIAPIIACAGLLPIIYRYRNRVHYSQQAMIIGLMFGTLVTFVLLCSYRTLNLRYYADFLPCWILLSGIMIIMVDQFGLGRHARRAFVGLTILTAAATIAMGYVLGLGGIQFAQPARAYEVRAALDSTAALLMSRVPGFAKGHLTEGDRSYWHKADGEYFWGATVYSRAPAEQPTAAIDVDLVADGPVMVDFLVDGHPVRSLTLIPGRQRVEIGPLAATEIGRVVPIAIKRAASEGPARLRVHDILLS